MLISVVFPTEKTIPKGYTKENTNGRSMDMLKNISKAEVLMLKDQVAYQERSPLTAQHMS